MTPKANTGRPLDIPAPPFRSPSRQMGTLALGHQMLALIWSTMGNPPKMVPQVQYTSWYGRPGVPPFLLGGGPFLDYLEGGLGNMETGSRPVAMLGNRRRTPHVYPPTGARLLTTLLWNGPRPLAGGSQNVAGSRLPKGAGLGRNKMRCETGFCLLQMPYVCGSTRASAHPSLLSVTCGTTSEGSSRSRLGKNHSFGVLHRPKTSAGS